MAEYGRLNAKKFEKKDLQERKEKAMTLSDYIQICQKIFNTYIRFRDQYEPCISCGKTLVQKYDAGHYFNAGGHPALRFDEDNVHGQCVRCNRDLHGNLIEYRDGLMQRIGIDLLTALESRKNEVRKYTITEVKELIKEYRLKIKQIQNK